ncbi:MAG: GGDEF domain-containing protein [Candidatus Adiutrix sp.]|nr:GGDEF domain-containing protein [Candidatus Adiutrix sp.]
MNDETSHKKPEPLELLERLIMRHDAPLEAPPGTEADESFVRTYETLARIKNALFHFSVSKWDFEFTARGTTAGYIKMLQSNLNNLAWKCRQVANGDLDQHIDFMGDISDAFNGMVESLKIKNEIVEAKQRELTAMTQKLKNEIKKKEQTEEALLASEEMYRQRSLRDPLTGIYNRGYFFESAEREMESMKRNEGAQCCILMIDIDHFKKFNDTFGHPVGDEAIKLVTSTINTTLRKADIFARYGGEEFILLLANTDIGTGAAIAERMRLAVFSQPGAVPGNSLPVTISIGLSVVSSNSLSLALPGDRILKTAIDRADAALYQAKAMGRNMVWIYQPGAEHANGEENIL